MVYRNEFTIRISSCGGIRKITSVVYISYNGGSGKTFMCPFMHRAGVLKSKCTWILFPSRCCICRRKMAIHRLPLQLKPPMKNPFYFIRFSTEGK
jgi:hypothetical protein